MDTKLYITLGCELKETKNGWQYYHVNYPPTAKLMGWAS